MDNVCTYKSQKIKDIRRMVQVARGEEPADLVLKNGEVFIRWQKKCVEYAPDDLWKEK